MHTRRQLLAWIAASPLAAQIERLDRRGPAQRVVILGAGLAGLCTAFELKQQGHRVTILEAQSRAGGRVRTLREGFAPGLHVEAGAETIPQAHDITQHYARTLGLTMLPVGVPGTRSFYHVGGKRIAPGDAAVWPFALTEEERRIGLAGLRQKYTEAAVQQALASGFWRQPMHKLGEWDAHKPGPWLRSLGASAGAVQLLSLGFGAEFGSVASFLLHRLNSMGTGPGFHIEGGNDRLPAEFAKRIDIRFGTPVVAVTQNERGVRISVRRPGGLETIDADRVVCTIPCPVIGKLFEDARLSPQKLRAIREQNYSQTVKVFLQARTRFWLKEGFSGNVTTDLPIERLTPEPGTDVDARGALAAYPIADYSATLSAMSEEERVSAALRQATEIFPQMATEFEGGISKCWALDPWQRGAFALHNPGQIGFIEVLAKPEGRIHFAGEHTSLWTGWMQGALESARRVVKEINA